MDILSQLSQWFFINVVLALLPLIINLVVISMFKDNERRKWKWINLFRDGELFFFSSTISATSISELVLRDIQTSASNQISASNLEYIHTFTLLPLMLVLLLSTVIFGCSAYTKLQEQLSGQQDSLLDDFRFSYGSIACAIAAIILGYVAFVQSRG